MQALTMDFALPATSSASPNRAGGLHNKEPTSRGLHFFHTMSLGSTTITDKFQVQIQMGNPSGQADRYERLHVAEYLTVSNVKVLIFREFGIPYEEQILFNHGTLLEDSAELGALNIHRGSTLYLVRQKRYRSIGTLQTTIKTLVLNPTATDGYELVDIPAPLPPFHLVIKRIVFAISYLRLLDRLQQPHTRNIIWTTRHVPSVQHQRARRYVPTSAKVKLAQDAEAALVALRTSLVISTELRSQSDMRAIKKWLGTVKYFVDAKVPDTSLLDVARHITYASFDAGDFVFRQGDSGDLFYIILKGSVSIAGHGLGLITTLQTGQCFGEVGLFKHSTGQRSASAIVNFDTPTTELCCISRDVYNRSVAQHKVDMLVEYEKLLAECPQFATLTKETLTHLAYAAESIAVEPGVKFLHTGTRIEHLYLLARGEFKITASTVVSVPVDDDDEDDAMDETRLVEKRATVMTLRRAPSLFGHEACTTAKSPLSQYDVQAVGQCLVLAFSKTTLRRFISSNDAIMREVLVDFDKRNADLNQRLDKLAVHVVKEEPSTDTEMAALDTFFAQTLSRQHESPTGAAQPATLLSPRKETSARKESLATPSSPKQATGFTTAFATMYRDHFHATLPHGDLLTYEQQVHYASKPSESLSKEEQMVKMNCLIDGLRRMQPVDVQLVNVVHHGGVDQYCFI
ncbi:hypothetical protein AeMF1_009728 [Aphanomyces euteiches]|nr:hypothetical protein AeMF1_009728 [Aphanomyces euteiches]